MRQGVCDNKIVEVPDNETDFEMPNRFFSSHINLIPLHNAVQGPRLFYGARFMNQAMPVKDPEAPWVQNVSEDGVRSYDELMGAHAGAIRAEKAGVVTEVAPDHIKWKGEDGAEGKTPLYSKFYYNRKSAIHNTPVVKAGDKIAPGQLLAHSNFTDKNGTLALGRNARVALVPFNGFSMDDAVVISEDFARKLTIDQTHHHQVDYERGIKGGLHHFVSLFPSKFTKDQTKLLDEDGVIKQGSIVQKGDPLVLATKPKTINSALQLGKLSKTAREARGDISEVWGEDEPGTVTDVVKTKDGSQVFVQAFHPAKLGSKIVFRSGQKSFHPDTELFTERGWVKIPDMLETDKVASLFDAAASDEIVSPRLRPQQQLVARFEKPYFANTYEFDGQLYGLAAPNVAYLVTGNHRIWRRCHTKCEGAWSCQDAAGLEGSAQIFLRAAPFDLTNRKDPSTFKISQVTHGVTKDEMACQTEFPFSTWVQFMAMYLAEGNIRHSRPGTHEIVITQKEKPFCRVIERVLSDMGFTWRIHGIQYRTSPNKALRAYLDQFGKAFDKFVPVEIKSGTLETIKLFLDTIWQCDGDKDGGKQYYSCSPRLIADIQDILLLCGRASSINSRPPRDHQNYIQHTLHIADSNQAALGTRGKHAYYREQYKGPVFCIQVPGLGVVLTRFRGKIMWNGNSIISKILPTDQVPRTADGQPVDVLLNHLGIPSRVNSSLPYELLLGKLAELNGTPYKLPAFNKKGEKWYDFVQAELDKHGVKDAEDLYDPTTNEKLENPVTVGNGYVLALHHTAKSKFSARGQGGYDQQEQPAKGGGEGAQAKRLSGLESSALMASGAYSVLREGATLKGQRSDEYWRALRSGYKPVMPGQPFVVSKFHALLNGAGFKARSTDKGKLRLGAFTDKDLDANKATEIRNGEMVDLYNELKPVEGGLFDEKLVGGNGWGKISLPHPLPNPAMEKPLRHLLGLTEKQLRAIIAGEMELPEHLRAR